jgi:hypothetical protein
MAKRTVLLLAVLLASACQAPARPVPPSMEEAGNVSYLGIDGSTVTLVDGSWEGEPWVQGGASRPAAGLADSLNLLGDLDGDGRDERVVLLWTSSGGSGTFDYVAVVARDTDGNAVNTGTAPLGDRVKVRSAEIVDRHLVFDVVQAGPNDAMCCPGQKVRRTFVLDAAGLQEISSDDLGRVSPDPAIH